MEAVEAVEAGVGKSAVGASVRSNSLPLPSLAIVALRVILRNRLRFNKYPLQSAMPFL